MSLTNVLAFMDVIKSMGSFILAILIFVAMITVHEFGHYVAGKALGFKITEFSIGFGPAIFKKRSKKTGELFAIRTIPLGGYCAFDGEEDFGEEEESEENLEKENLAKESLSQEQGETPVVVEKEEGMSEMNEEYPQPQGALFNEQAPWKRIIVLVAGATMNYLFALLLLLSMFIGMGRPMYEVTKAMPGENASIGAVETYESGLKTGDIIKEVDGKTIYIISDCADALNGKKKGEIVEVLVLRNGEETSLEIALFEDANVKNMTDNSATFFALGIAYREEVENEQGEMQLSVTRGGSLAGVSVREGFFQTIGSSFAYSFKIGGTILRTLGELLSGKIGLNSMGGPITTITMTAEAASSGVMSFLNIAAFIGVNLAVFNLLPVPALD